MKIVAYEANVLFSFFLFPLFSLFLLSFLAFFSFTLFISDSNFDQVVDVYFYGYTMEMSTTLTPAHVNFLL